MFGKLRRKWSNYFFCVIAKFTHGLKFWIPARIPNFKSLFSLRHTRQRYDRFFLKIILVKLITSTTMYDIFTHFMHFIYAIWYNFIPSRYFYTYFVLSLLSYSNVRLGLSFSLCYKGTWSALFIYSSYLLPFSHKFVLYLTFDGCYLKIIQLTISYRTQAFFKCHLTLTLTKKHSCQYKPVHTWPSIRNWVRLNTLKNIEVRPEKRTCKRQMSLRSQSAGGRKHHMTLRHRPTLRWYPVTTMKTAQ